MNTQRNVSYRKHWRELIRIYGARCFYCREEPATTIDHVVPYSWDADNGIENLVPACCLCNLLASNKVFESVEHKRQYIMSQRKNRSSRRAICSECLLPYGYLLHSPSLFLCAECYDREYDTGYSKKKAWSKWVIELAEAGIPIEAHRSYRKIVSRKMNRKERIDVLIGEYSACAEHDDQFAEMLFRA